MIKILFNLTRFRKQLFLIFIDCLLLLLIPYLSLAIRLNSLALPEDFRYKVLIILSPFIAIPIFIYFGFYRAILRYIGLRFIVTIFFGISLYAAIFSFIIFMLPIDGFPRSMILINYLLSLNIITGLRLIALLLFSRNNLGEYPPPKKIIVYGAGNSGIQLLASLAYSNEYKVVGLIDDKKSLHGKFIKGIEVSPSAEIQCLVRKEGASEIFLSISSISKDKKNILIESLGYFDVKIKVLPGIEALTRDEISPFNFRDIELNDLLGRSPVLPNKKILSRNITDKIVLITGAGGSIGSELCRQVIKLKPKVLILFEINEFFLYKLEGELRNKEKRIKIQICPILGDVKDFARLNKVFNKFKPDTVYHSAAYKHVPLVQHNISQAIEVNIYGTICCIKAAIRNNVETFVYISTDKAVRPTNVMGASKGFAENVLLSYAKKNHQTKISIVRFGNVLGSSGSVVPLFNDQIKNGGPITVTHKKITRYFMTIPEAVELVIQAGAIGGNGDIFVLDMGDPISIDFIAKKMIVLSGKKIKDKLNSNGDIEIKYVGLRPGEKMHEELYVDNNIVKTVHPRIFISREKYVDESYQLLKNIKRAMKEGDYKEILINLSKGVVGYKIIGSERDFYGE